MTIWEATLEHEFYINGYIMLGSRDILNEKRRSLYVFRRKKRKGQLLA